MTRQEQTHVKIYKNCVLQTKIHPKDHPLQWEALGDFTEDGDMAMDIYDIALASASKLGLATFTASIYLSMAQRQQEFEESDKAIEYAKQAEIASVGIDDNELKEEIKTFLAAY